MHVKLWTDGRTWIEPEVAISALREVVAGARDEAIAAMVRVQPED
jgi:hypothetical protein